MPETTPNGWPYVTPEDHPLEYPALSQQLATMLDAQTIKASISVVTTDDWGVGTVPIPAGFVLAMAIVSQDQPWIVVVRSNSQVGVFSAIDGSRVIFTQVTVRWLAYPAESLRDRLTEVAPLPAPIPGPEPK